ncbi:MAG: hypothetical protein CVU77_06040 [Elusimicrobia bacterium HGW-Elusimicrobia-1]|jgi:hypothetical protein|nr:MAG: hypothetical protein CVU79_08350 [Elusimicrobia bacterium HGW-Elusimicrobia-3]PKN01240.1 MAG: hypothetical protein CVU77_06040 [Elusimicrobia bacterium HGW-Elusimicrobia-1]
MTRESKQEIIKVEGNFIELFPARFERARSRRSRPDSPVETIITPNGKITVNHHSRLFSAFDMDVMLAAFALAYRHTERRFQAVLADFARVMRLNPFGKNLVKIRESLNELALTPAEFVESWRDNKNRRYTSEAVTSFIAYRLVARREIVESKLSPKEIRDGSWIAIPDLFYDSIDGGYFKYIDTEVYFSLPSGLSRAAFLYLEKRLGLKNYYEENIGSALANIIKRPAKPQDIKDFKRRTLPKLSGVFHFDKTKLDNGTLVIARQLSFRSASPGTATTAAAEAATEEKADAAATATTAAVSVGAAAETTAVAGAAAAAETAAIADAAAVGIGATIATVAATAMAAAEVSATIATVAATADGDFTPRTAMGVSADLPSNPATPSIRGDARPVRPSLPKNLAAHSDTAQVSQPRVAPPPRKKLTSHGEYVLERACIFCNRDDDYFKNVIKKYIFILGSDLVDGAIGDTRDADAESKDRYLIHLLKNM